MRPTAVLLVVIAGLGLLVSSTPASAGEKAKWKKQFPLTAGIWAGYSREGEVVDSFGLWVGYRYHPSKKPYGPFASLGLELYGADAIGPGHMVVWSPTVKIGFEWAAPVQLGALYGIFGVTQSRHFNYGTRIGIGAQTLFIPALAADSYPGIPMPSTYEVIWTSTEYRGEIHRDLRFQFGFSF